MQFAVLFTFASYLFFVMIRLSFFFSVVDATLSQKYIFLENDEFVLTPKITQLVIMHTKIINIRYT